MFRRLLIKLGNWLREPELGDKVVLISDAELFDSGIIRKGATGVVVMKTWVGQPAEPIGSVLMDERCPALDHWDNKLVVWSEPGPQGNVTWSQFKNVTGL